MHRFSALVVGRLLVVALCASPLLGQLSVRHVRVLDSKDAVEIEIEASDRVTPQTRMLTGPDRLVIDFPNAMPGSDLRNQSVDRGDVKDIRFGLFQSRPPVTRIVLDLKTAQSFQVFPYGRTVIIKVSGGGADASAVASRSADQPTKPGLVAANFTTGSEPIHVDAPPQPPLEVSFRNDLLSIRADKATLSDVLNAIHQKTGAEISIPPGSDQEKVVVNLGPAPAPEVLEQLLHGSRFNFLIMSAANNPARLDRVILSPRVEGMSAPLPPMPVNNNQVGNNDDATDPVPPPQPQPDNAAQQNGMDAPRTQPEIPPGGDDPPNL
ncbi:MAG TPA: AMIN domain-containing protein [Verrucomicrobiae bacterium]|nr:AMIN domain-containing protein [Verrucomicrobiae bacterium]